MKANLYKLLKTPADISPMAQYAAMIQYSADNNAVVFDGSNIAANTIYGGHIRAGSIVTEHIKAGSIVSDSIATSGILANKIVGGSLYSTVPLNQGGSFIDLDSGNINIGGGNIVWNNTTKELTINAKHLTLDDSTVLHEGSDLPDLINKNNSITRISGNKLHFTNDVLMDKTFIDLLYANQAFIEALRAIEINADRIKTGTLDANIVNVVNLDADNITTGTLSANFIKGGTIDASNVNITNLKADNITTGVLDTSKFIVKNLSASVIQTGTLDANKVTVANLSANAIKAGTLDASVVNVANLSADSITGGTIDARNVNIKYLDASEITTGTLDIGGNVTISAGGLPVMLIDSETRELTFNISRLTINASPVLTEENIPDIEKNVADDLESKIKPYVHLAYADSSDGEIGFTFEEGNKAYIGIYSDYQSEPSMSPNRYLWSRIKGDETFTAYAINPQGEGFSLSPFDGAIYIGFFTGIVASQKPTDYEWFKAKGEDSFKVEVHSSNGSTFKNGVIDTWIYAVVYEGHVDVTEQINLARFKWERVSSDPVKDKQWNDAHAGGVKEFRVTKDDIYQRATFSCEILE